MDAILSGQRVELAKLRDPHIRASAEIIRKSPVGNWRPGHLFTLKMSRGIYRYYQEQIAACDEEIEKLVVHFPPRVDLETRPLPPDRKKKARKRNRRNSEPALHAKAVPSRLRCTDGSLQVVRRGRDADSGAADHGLPAVQRSRARYVAVADGGALCILAGIMPRQRYQWGTGAVEGPAKGENSADNCFVWQPTVCVMSKARWGTICPG